MLVSRTFRLLLAGSLVAASSLALADSGSVKGASTSLTENPLALAGARLMAAVDRAEDAMLDDAATYRERESLLARARDLGAEAAVTRRTGSSLAALIASLDATRDGLLALADGAIVAAGGEAGGAEAATDSGHPNPYPSAVAMRFHATSQNALSVLPNLTGAEQRDVRQLIQAGDDVIAQIKDVRGSDHVERTKHLRSVEGITENLQALYQTGLLDRKKGRPFLRGSEVAGGWIPLSEKADGLSALRVSFVKPATAWVVLQNTGDAPRRYFVQMEFYDAFGEATGTAQAENAALRELKPGEVRRVEVQMTPAAARFWDVTRGFAVYVE